MLFDLDPPEEDGAFALCVRVAHYLRAALEELELDSYVKTSGADGIHILVPIVRRSSFEETYEFAELLSRKLEAEHPGEVTTEWLKKKRAGVLVDHRQNGHGQDDRVGLLGAAEAGRAGVDAAALGRADRGRAPARLLDAGGARPRRRSTAISSSRCCTRSRRSARALKALALIATDWVAVSSIATAGATLVLAFATFASVRSANRAARAAERSLLAGLRPVLMPSRPEDPPQKVGFMDDKWFHVPGSGGIAEATDEAIYLAIAIRNVGSGIAVLHGWQLWPQIDGGAAEHPPIEDFHRLTRDLYIAPGEVGFWQGTFRDPQEPAFAEARAGDRGASPHRDRRALRRPRARPALDHALRADAARGRSLDRHRRAPLERRPPRSALGERRSATPCYGHCRRGRCG